MRGPSRWVALLLALPLPGCRTATTITVEVRTDIPCADVGVTRVVAAPLTELATRAPSASRAICEGEYLGTLVVVPAGDKNAELAIGISTSLSGATECVEGDARCVVARRVLRFIPHQDLRIVVHMRDGCRGARCKPEETCVRGRCVPAIIPDTSGCAPYCDESALAPSPDAGVDAPIDSLPLPVKRVFVTSGVWSGNLGGLAGADAKCTTAAASAGLTGTFAAWLSVGTVSAKSRVSSPARFETRDGTFIYEGSLPPTTLVNPIDHDENGKLVTPVPSTEVWTNTSRLGVSAGSDDCGGFMSTTAGTGLSTVGRWDATDDRWTIFSVEVCGNPAHLYCFQL